MSQMRALRPSKLVDGSHWVRVGARAWDAGPGPCFLEGMERGGIALLVPGHSL